MDLIFVARDPIGVRPAFVGWTDSGGICVASEAKAMTDFCSIVQPFPPGKCWIWHRTAGRVHREITHYHYHYPRLYHFPKRGQNREVKVLQEIRSRLEAAVQKRMMSDREIGCLLSGGLDSSLIAALVARNSEKGKLKTFSIGMEGSIDLKYAQLVADHIGSDHHQIQLTEEDFLQAIPEVIRRIESFDTTTVRASVGNWLVSRYIAKNSSCKVIFNGDGSVWI